MGVKEIIGAVKDYYSQVGISENVGLPQQCLASRLGSSSSKRWLTVQAGLAGRFSINVLSPGWHDTSETSLEQVLGRKPFGI